MTQTHKSFFSRWSAAEVMLVTLFLLAPLYYHANPGGDGLRIPHSPVIWLIAVIFITYSLLQTFNQNRYMVPRYFYFVIAFPILATLSGFSAGIESPLNWLFRVLFIWGGGLFFFCLFQYRWSQSKIERVMYFLVVSGIAHGAIGYFQVWFKTELPFLKSPNGIPSGLFQQVNNEATFLVTVILIAFYLISRPSIRVLRWYWHIPIIVALAISAYVVMASGSRIGVLALITGLPIMFLARRKQLYQAKRLMLVSLLTVIMGGLVASVYGSSRVLEKTTAIQSGYTKESRVGIYGISFRLVQEKPIFGHGIGSFAGVFQMKRPDFFKEHKQAILPSQMVSHPHNEMLFWLVEGGVIAFIGILCFVFGTLLAIIACGWNRGGAYFAMMLPLALHLQVEVPFYVSALPWFVFLFLLSLPFRHYQKYRIDSLSLSTQKMCLIATWGMFIFMVVFLLHTVIANWDFNKFMHAERNPERHKMSYALSNPYLSGFAYEVEAATYLRAALTLHDESYLKSYSSWAQDKLKLQPSPLLMRNLILSQLGTDTVTEACRNYQFAKSMYPRSSYLSEQPSVCM